MAIGETLLKITDYPFAYSLTAIFLATGGISLFSEDSLVFLAIAGSAGTILAITDPFGRGIKWFMMSVEKRMYYFLRNEKSSENKWYKFMIKINPKILDELKINKNWEEFASAFHTKSIEVEQEKIVSAVYFLIIIMITNIMISSYGAIENNADNDILKKICDIPCVKSYSEWILTGMSFVLAGIIAWNASKIFRKVRTVSTYLTAINYPVVTKASTENLSRFIETGDWKTAEYWRDIVENEFLNEQGLTEERSEKLKNHLNLILSKFKSHKESIDDKNREALNHYAMGDRSFKRTSLIEMLQSFPYYENLIEHFFTSKNNIKHNQVLNVLELDKKWEESFKSTDKEKTDKIHEITSHLKFRVDKKSKVEILGENGQWINLELLNIQLDHFVSSSRTMLIPVSLKPNSPLWQVRIFDRRGHEDIGPDVIAELNENDANALTIELEQLSANLKEKNSISQKIYSDLSEAEKNLKQMIDELIREYESIVLPISGSCKYCRNEEFWSKHSIDKDEEKIKAIPSIMYPIQKKSKW